MLLIFITISIIAILLSRGMSLRERIAEFSRGAGQKDLLLNRNGKFAGMFPEQWLPKAIAVLPEAFTEQNHMVNSTMKIVRGKVEEFYADRIEYAYTPEGKELMNEKNIASL